MQYRTKILHTHYLLRLFVSNLYMIIAKDYISADNRYCVVKFDHFVIPIVHELFIQQASISHKYSKIIEAFTTYGC